jgi:crotonobetainyl-CoA:carnitine CoA-transferase CaiB-like acyl-CoA transferase
VITACTQDRTSNDVAMEILNAGLAAGPFLNLEQVFNHPQVTANEMLIDTPDYHGTGLPMTFLRTPGAFHAAPPRFAAHTDEVFAEVGLSAQDIAQLEASGGIIRQRSAIVAEPRKRA